MFEELIASHCAPALAGIKPANLVTCRKSEFDDVSKEVGKLNFQLNSCGIYAEILSESKNGTVLMVYRKDILEKHLQNSQNKAFLAMYGYDGAEKTEEYLNILRSRLEREDFPHEVGVFLGYPLRDIYCFIHHRNEGCIMVGDWRVYHNAEQAKKLFCRFKSCKRALSEKVAGGKTLAQIFRAS